ncbi:MAG: 1-acyl-sn-glycerol-3-phosphate acyltransferase [Pseudohongiellaceae bacterium]
MDQFGAIRPYNDDEIRPVLDKLVDNPEFVHSIAVFNHPRLARLLPAATAALARYKLSRQFRHVHNVASMQDVIAGYMDKMIEDTTTGLTHSGLDNLEEGRSYLFISNHRDITMDPAFVNYMLYHAGFETLQIAIGDNLLKKPFVSDLMRLNKSFIVRRSLKGRELLKALTLLSQYIHHCIESGHNVWIAQREGRAKNGVYRTDPALVKMLAMAHRGLPLGDSIGRLHVVPVAISYEYDACDVLKAEELYQLESTGSFVKDDRSDIQSIVTGMIGFKGRVHVAFGSEIGKSLPLSNDPERIAREIDQQILASYRLHDNNFLALEKLQESGLVDVPELEPTVAEYRPDVLARQKFEARLAKVDSHLHKHYLSMYANPAINRFAVGAELFAVEE